MSATPPLEEKVLGWLVKQGFPLEMRIAQLMTDQKFRVTQSAYYTDFETGTPREIDLLTRLYAFYEPPKDIAISEIELFCAIECKASKNPWIVFKQTEAISWNTDRSIASKTGRSLLLKANSDIRVSQIERFGRLAGHGAREAFTDSDRVFAAMMAALKAAEALVLAADKTDEKLRGQDAEFVNIYSVLAFPIVVTTAPLFECRLLENGQLNLVSVDLSSVVLRYPRSRDDALQGAVVYVITEQALPTFTKWILEYLELVKLSLALVLPKKL